MHQRGTDVIERSEDVVREMTKAECRRTCFVVSHFDMPIFRTLRRRGAKDYGHHAIIQNYWQHDASVNRPMSLGNDNKIWHNKSQPHLAMTLRNVKMFLDLEPEEANLIGDLGKQLGALVTKSHISFDVLISNRATVDDPVYQRALESNRPVLLPEFIAACHGMTVQHALFFEPREIMHLFQYQAPNNGINGEADDAIF
uniref:BRCT domain-containing protein n=1 Tax=Panagrolaimus sp. JU765 TaxID=591449 RepID=A0AC34RKG4_9BILA